MGTSKTMLKFDEGLRNYCFHKEIQRGLLFLFLPFLGEKGIEIGDKLIGKINNYLVILEGISYYTKEMETLSLGSPQDSWLVVCQTSSVAQKFCHSSVKLGFEVTPCSTSCIGI